MDKDFQAVGAVLQDEVGAAVSYTHLDVYKRQGYLRLKVLELLHILSRLKDRDDVQQTDYFNQHQVECARRAAKPVSYTHLDVYKRQAFFRAGYVFSAILEQIIRCGNRI